MIEMGRCGSKEQMPPTEARAAQHETLNTTVLRCWLSIAPRIERSHPGSCARRPRRGLWLLSRPHSHQMASSAAVWLLGGAATGFVVQPSIRSCPLLPLLRSTPTQMLLPASVSVQLALTAAEWNNAGMGSTRENPSDIPAEFMVWGLGSIALLITALAAAIIFKVQRAGVADEAAAQAIVSVSEALAANESKKERLKKKTKKARRDNR